MLKSSEYRPSDVQAVPFGAWAERATHRGPGPDRTVRERVPSPALRLRVKERTALASIALQPAGQRRPLQVSLRTVRNAIDNALMAPTRHEPEIILAGELNLPWTHAASPAETRTKREPIGDYTPGWSLPQLIGLGRRIVTELDLEYATADLRAVLEEHDRQGGGVDSPAKNLIFAARLAASIADNPAESVIFDAYRRRYKDGFGIPALIPQVYLHYDPYTRAARGAGGSLLARRRMDFLLLFSDRQRVVIEVDGRQHYADDQGRANASLYARMVAEDRRLRLAGYEVYRFGGHELLQPGAAAMASTFFSDLQQRMT